MERANFTKWEELLENIDTVKRGDLFEYAEKLYQSVVHYEQEKKQARHEYNIAVDNYNRIKEIGEEIKTTLKQRDSESLEQTDEEAV